ncbi:MAG: alpha/beta fold hydrolase [Chlorobi bacterium]|nr:alpha/beta fold hydrolase [Chlorobiota bacterium]
MVFHETGSGPCLVLLHAFPLNAGMWSREHYLLANHYRVLSLDYPGFGMSLPEQEGFTLPLLGDRILEKLRVLGIEQFVIGGCSMGGYLALEIARRHPPGLKGMVLIDTRSTADSEEARTNRYLQIVEIKSHGAGALMQRLSNLLVSEYSRANQPALVEYLERTMKSASIDGVTHALRAMAERADTTEDVRGLAVPVLVVAGEEDALITQDEAEQLADLFPHSSFHLLPQAGHLPNLEQPELFLNILTSFLQTVSFDD